MMDFDTDDLRKWTKRSRCPSRDQLDDLGSDLGAFEEMKDGLSDLVDALEGVQLDTLGDVIERLDGLLSNQDIEKLEESAAHIEQTLSLIRDDMPIAEFVEQYDNSQSKLEELVELKESDGYSGKSDDVQTAWDEMVAEIESLCECVDQLDPGDLEGAG